MTNQVMKSLRDIGARFLRGQNGYTPALARGGSAPTRTPSSISGGAPAVLRTFPIAATGYCAN
jgi:hypothetical protein